MPIVTISLDIPAAEYLNWYKGTARVVFARSAEGLSVQFPASVLQRFVTRDGIHGTFKLTYDDEHRFVDIENLDPPAGLDRLA